MKQGAGNVARYLSDLLQKENENSSSSNLFEGVACLEWCQSETARRRGKRAFYGTASSAIWYYRVLTVGDGSSASECTGVHGRVAATILSTHAYRRIGAQYDAREERRGVGAGQLDGRIVAQSAFGVTKRSGRN